MKIHAVVTDIEGTTSSLSFVKDTLFPYARQRMGDFVRTHGDDPALRQQLAAVSSEVGCQLSVDEAVSQLNAWIDEDRKIGALKAIQGMIWESGYRNGDFVGHVYDDAVRGLRRWKEEGIKLYVYSSGSIHAQKLLFGHTRFGDLNPLFSGYFDTGSGNKREPDSYRRIAGAVGGEVSTILFLSDIREELDAANAAGMPVYWLIRDGAIPAETKFPVARRFDDIRITVQPATAT